MVRKLGLPPEESRLAEFSFDPAYTAVDARPVSNLDGLGKKAIALLASDDTEVRPIIDTRFVLGKRLRKIRFSKGHQAVALDILPDQNGNQAEEALVLARQTAYDRPRVLIRDLDTKERIKAISLPKIFEPLDVAVIPDVNGNGFNEALVLAARKSDGRDFFWFGIQATRVRLCISSASRGQQIQRQSTTHRIYCRRAAGRRCAAARSN